MAIDGAGCGAPAAEISIMTVRRTGEEVDVFPVKPFFERFVKLYQGQQFDEFEVDATHFHPDLEGLLGMAMSRVKVISIGFAARSQASLLTCVCCARQSLDGLRLVGVRNRQALKAKATADWKVVLFMSQYIRLPHAAIEWARRRQELWRDSWAQFDCRGQHSAAAAMRC